MSKFSFDDRVYFENKIKKKNSSTTKKTLRWIVFSWYIIIFFFRKRTQNRNQNKLELLLRAKVSCKEKWKKRRKKQTNKQTIRNKTVWMSFHHEICAKMDNIVYRQSKVFHSLFTIWSTIAFSIRIQFSVSMYKYVCFSFKLIPLWSEK